MEATTAFEVERPRLLVLARRVLEDRAEAEDVVQQAWLRLHGTDAVVEDLPAWLTTVTTRLCLDRLRRRLPVPHAEVGGGASPDPADGVVLADSVGAALSVVVDRLSPRERVALVLHDAFTYEFSTIADVLGTTPAAARKLASRARTKLGRAEPQDLPTDGEVVDAFMAAARGGDLAGLLRLLAPDVEVRADAAAVLAGTPERLDGHHAVAAFFDGGASAAVPALLGERPVAAWFLRGEARVVFDTAVADGVVAALTFRADPAVLALVTRRRRGPAPAPRA